MNSFRSIIILILIFVTHNLIYTQTVRLDPTRTYYWYYDNSLPTNGIRDGNLNPLSQSDQQTFVRNTIESVLYSICKYSERDPIFHFEETTNINSADLIITFATKIELAGCNQNSLVPNTIIFSNDPHQQFAPPGQYYWTNTITTWDPRGVRGTNKYNPFFKCLLLHEVVAHVFAIGHSTTGNESDVTREDPTAYSPSGDEQTKLKDNYNPKFDLAIRNYFSGGMAVDAAGLVTIDKSTSAVYDESIPSGGKIVTFAEEELNILLSAKRQQADGHW